MEKEKIVSLVTKAQQGDQTAMQSLMDGFYSQLYYYTYQYVQDPDLAGDITQETCISIITDLPKLRHPEAFVSWSYQIVENKVKLHRRKTVREMPAQEDQEGNSIFDTLEDTHDGVLPEQVCEDQDFQNTMTEFLNNLPLEQRMALMLYYYEEMSVKDIAALQGISEGTVKSRLNYGRKAVKQQVENYEKKTGTRLHSIAPLPLLLAYLFRQNAKNTAAVGAAPAVSAALGGTAVKAAAGLATKKLVGILLAAAVTVGAVGGAIGLGLLGDPGHQDTKPGHSQQEPTLPPTPKDSQGLVYTEILGETGTAIAYTVTGIGTCTDDHIVIPTSYQGLPVTHISSDAFRGNLNITGITIPSSITYISSNSFRGCQKLKTIYVHEGIQELSQGAFMGCAVETVYLPDSLQRISAEAFLNCNYLQSIRLPKDLQYIGESAFRGCAQLKSIHLPDPLIGISADAFRDCTALADVQFGSKLTRLSDRVFQGCTSLKEIAIPDTVTELLTHVFRGCTALETANIPKGITVLNFGLFQECSSLKGIVIPAGVTLIETQAFNQCTSLTSIVIPEGVTKLGDTVFLDCPNLAEVQLPSTLTTLGSSTFGKCTSLTKILLPASLNEVHRFSFSSCANLTEIQFEGTLANWNAMFRRHESPNPGNITVRCSDGERTW